MRYLHEPDLTLPELYNSPVESRKTKRREIIIDRFLDMYELGVIIRLLKIEDQVRNDIKDHIVNLPDDDLKTLLKKYRWDVDLYI